MSARSAQGGASAPSNVVRLPTAAPRKVRTPQTKAERLAAESHPVQFPKEASRFAHKPWVRTNLKKAQLLMDADAATDRTLARMIFRALDKATQSKVEIYLALDSDRLSARQALAWVRYETADADTKRDIERACELLVEGEVR